jgi:hypothetical protein
MLLKTHNPYKPAVIAWPTLAPEALKRVTELPIWDIAVHTEGRASIRAQAFADSVRDPLLHAALAMDAAEEARHKVVLSKLVQAYGIALQPEPAYVAPKSAEWAWLVTGYGECIDSFFAFGLFEVARRSRYFPQELVDTFEPVMQEEARHILFFVNWSAWHRRTLSWTRRPGFMMKVCAAWVFLIWERIAIARGLDRQSQLRCQFRHHRRGPDRCSGRTNPAARALPRGERAAHGRLRPTPVATNYYSARRAAGAVVFQAQPHAPYRTPRSEVTGTPGTPGRLELSTETRLIHKTFPRKRFSGVPAPWHPIENSLRSFVSNSAVPGTSFRSACSAKPRSICRTKSWGWCVTINCS